MLLCVYLRLYLSRGEKPYENSHPCYWYPWLVHVQMLKALMEEPAYTNRSVEDRNKAVSAKNG